MRIEDNRRELLRAVWAAEFVRKRAEKRRVNHLNTAIHSANAAVVKAAEMFQVSVTTAMLLGVS